MLGKKLPSLKDIWGESAPHFIVGSAFSFGQFALDALAVALILTPVFGLTDLAGSILVRYAIKNPKTPVARRTPPSKAEGLDLSNVGIAPADKRVKGDVGMSPVTAAFMFIALAAALAIVILEVMRFAAGLFDVHIFDNFPLFPFTVIGGFLVQLIATRFKQDHHIDRATVTGISSISLDTLIASAIGTMSLAALGGNVPALVILTVIAVGWSVFGLIFLAPRIHGPNWFEHGLADFGQSQGNVATGFILADMADPKHQTMPRLRTATNSSRTSHSWAAASSLHSASRSSSSLDRCGLASRLP